MMRIVRSIKLMQEISRKLKINGKTIGFVPTMGALHEGHLSLIRQARRENDFVVVSIFVNPTQFGPKEDFKKYPRDLKNDARLCAKEKVDYIFYPDARQMYPEGHGTSVDCQGLGDVLCGKSRPGHFKGVATVVIKLFNIVSPDKAYFGQKDAQQALIIKKAAQDLNLPVKIKVLATVRAKDGLALSSRNSNLDQSERLDARVIPQALSLARKLIKKRNYDTKAIIREMRKMILAKKTARIDYISIVDLDSLQPLAKIKENSLIALGIWIGKTRLIDNIIMRKYA